MKLLTKFRNTLKKEYPYYIFLLPALLYFLIFHYIPMAGSLIAFTDYKFSTGIFGSQWVGLKYFNLFFNSFQFWGLIKNTLGLSLYGLFAGFPFPILLAISLNSINNRMFKKILQTTLYAPHFISIVVLSGIVYIFLAPKTGIINNFIGVFGINDVFFMGKPGWFQTIFVFSGLWQNVGWGSIVYLAALTSIDKEKYEAAIIDGANKLRLIWHIEIPAIMPTVVVMFILAAGRIMNLDFQKVLLLQNSMNLSVSEIITTYSYRMGLLGGQLSYGAAIGFFNSIINLILIVIVNAAARKYSESSIW